MMRLSGSGRLLPRLAYALLFLGAFLQLGVHALWPPPQVRMEQLPVVVPASWLRVLSVGEPEVVAKLGMLWLQAFDYQAGLERTWRDLDPQRMEGWLGTFLDLDPLGQYPLLAAVRFYGNVPDQAQQRRFATFAYRRFFDDPQRRWPWLAHAAIMARHRWHDLPVALHYAQTLRLYVAGPGVPSWVRQQEFGILQEMGEWAQAGAVVRSLLTDGTVLDPRERHFLQQRLDFLNNCSAATCQGEHHEP